VLGIAASTITNNMYLAYSTTGSLGGTNAGGVDTWVAKEGPALINDTVYRFYNSATHEHF